MYGQPGMNSQYGGMIGGYQQQPGLYQQPYQQPMMQGYNNSPYQQPYQQPVGLNLNQQSGGYYNQPQQQGGQSWGFGGNISLSSQPQQQQNQNSLSGISLKTTALNSKK